MTCLATNGRQFDHLSGWSGSELQLPGAMIRTIPIRCRSGMQNRSISRRALVKKKTSDIVMIVL